MADIQDGNSLEEMWRIAQENGEVESEGDPQPAGDPPAEPEGDSDPPEDLLESDDEDPSDPSGEDPDGSSDPEDPEGEPESESQPEGPSRGLMQWFEQTYGLDMSKYASDADALHGMANAMKLLGQRNEDAAWAAKIKPHKDKIEALLSGDDPTPAPSPRPGDDEPEYDESWETLIQSGNASKEVIEKYNRHVAWERKKLRELLKHPETLVDTLLEQRLEERLKPIEQTTKQQAEAAAVREKQEKMQAWIAQHKNDLYVNGDPTGDLTPLGKKAAELYQSDPFIRQMADQIQDDVALSEMALRLARGSVPKPNKTRKVPKPAMRTPNIATTPAEKGDVESAVEKIQGGSGLADVLAELGLEPG